MTELQGGQCAVPGHSTCPHTSQPSPNQLPPTSADPPNPRLHPLTRVRTLQVWLQRVVDSMRAALLAEYRAAIPAYDERPRMRWVFDYSAQNTIVVSRTFYTQEVGRLVGSCGCLRGGRGGGQQTSLHSFLLPKGGAEG